MTDWPFDDPPNCACIVTKDVFKGAPIMRVYHDFEGDWQFHGSEASSDDPDAAKLVSLSSMVSQDNSLLTLHDLPYGWMASRSGPSEKWKREKHHPYPTYKEDGFYLEDAHWLAEFLPDIQPPGEDAVHELRLGDYVKLVFRFRSEEAERQDNECERMWVQITDFDEDEDVFTGTLENDPHHQGSIQSGDSLCFHTSHIMAILDDSED